MIGFEFMDKSRAEELLPVLFGIMYENMDPIAPSGASYDEDLAEYMGNVLPALEKTARQIVLIKDDEILIGFFQYYVNETVFMMEEIQFVKDYQGKGVFRALYRFLRPFVPETVPFVEAYSHINNMKSQRILEYMGLEKIGTNRSGNCLHYRGDAAKMWKTVLG